jgi:hypothetical protein
MLPRWLSPERRILVGWPASSRGSLGRPRSKQATAPILSGHGYRGICSRDRVAWPVTCEAFAVDAGGGECIAPATEVAEEGAVEPSIATAV